MMGNNCLVVGHRGFKGRHTENTIHGFEKCFEAGATIIETDVWTTKDHVLVISHDSNTKRVFCDENGSETAYNILDTNYEQLKGLRTIGSGELLITFQEMLRWFVDYVKEENGGDAYKIMLDLKNANPPSFLKLLFNDMVTVCNDFSWWFSHVQIGIWNLRFLKYLNRDDYFQPLFRKNQGFDIFHISLSWQDSMVYLAYNDYLDNVRHGKGRVQFKISGISLVHVTTWSTDFLTAFMPALRKQDLKLYTWTVNRESQLWYFCALCEKWQLREYGVVTDFPDEMVEVLSRDLVHPCMPETDEKTPLSVLIPTNFLVVAWLMRVLMYFSKPQQLSANLLFDSHVMPHETLSVKPKLGNRIFALMQAWGFV